MRTLAGVMVLLCACQGLIDGGLRDVETTDQMAPSPPRCVAAGKGSAARMRLLWRTAYLNELTTHLGEGAAAAAVNVGLSPATDKYFSFASAGSLVTDASLESLADVADGVAVWALSSDAIAQSVFGCKARTVVGAAAEQCFEAFVRKKGARLLRHSLSESDVRDLMTFFRAETLKGESDAEQEGFRQGLASLLTHPDFLYVRDAAVGSSSSLDPFSLASRLSFAVTGRGPDDLLFEAARTGALMQPEILSAHVDRLMSSAEATRQSKAFYREWLGYDRASVAYSSAFLAGLDATGLSEASTSELDDFVADLTWSRHATPAELLTARSTHPLPASLAAIYGTTPGATTLPAQRAGLLTRVGLLATGGDDWHVVGRGLSVVTKLLCRTIEPPAFSVADAIKQAESLKISNVDRIATVTSPATCAGCHRLINPLGSARADFDAIGRTVTTEKHFAGGTFDFEVPVVATADLSVPLGHPATVNGSVELSNLLAAAPEYQDCYAKQFVRFSLGRNHHSDACLAAAGAEVIASGGSMLEAMRAVLTSPELTVWRDE